MKSATTERSIVIAGRKTKISLEEPFWISAEDIAADRNITFAQFVRQIDRGRKTANLSSAIRQVILDHFVSLSTEARVSMH